MSMAIELRESGAAEPVPIAIEKLAGPGSLVVRQGVYRSGDGYLIKPQRPLGPGDVTLSFLDDCGPYTGSPLVSPPRRNERFVYHVGPAAPLPQRGSIPGPDSQAPEVSAGQLAPGGGCDCAVTERTGGPAPWLLLVSLALFRRRRHRRGTGKAATRRS